jgi:K+-transporting ATPase ATPase C chain
MQDALASLRAVIVTLLVCCVLYTSAVWIAANLLVPDKATGSLVRDSSGQVIGSRQIAQAFTGPEYVWPRPSAVSYNAAASGGSNLSPLNPKLAERASGIIARLQPAGGQLVPADLLAASGSGMDPHISRAAAIFQAPRVAAARGIAVRAVRRKIDALAYSPEGLGLAAENDRIVNVLELNMALDAMSK